MLESLISWCCWQGHETTEEWTVLTVVTWRGENLEHLKHSGYLVTTRIKSRNIQETWSFPSLSVCLTTNSSYMSFITETGLLPWGKNLIFIRIVFLERALKCNLSTANNILPTYSTCLTYYGAYSTSPIFINLPSAFPLLRISNEAGSAGILSGRQPLDVLFLCNRCTVS